MSALLYGCESWTEANVEPVMLHNWCLKKLLGVRKPTCNDLIYVDSGYHPLQTFTIYREHNFCYNTWKDEVK